MSIGRRVVRFARAFQTAASGGPLKPPTTQGSVRAFSSPTIVTMKEGTKCFMINFPHKMLPPELAQQYPDPPPDGFVPCVAISSGHSSVNTNVKPEDIAKCLSMGEKESRLQKFGKRFFGTVGVVLLAVLVAADDEEEEATN